MDLIVYRSSFALEISDTSERSTMAILIALPLLWRYMTSTTYQLIIGPYTMKLTTSGETR
jgi:hypothetical protein